VRTTGIIAEYNPIHNGHIRHLEKAREAGKADFVVAVMSGDFTQRGEPAIFDKWMRAEMAVDAGIDLVVELPFVYSCGSAEYFAEGGVKVLRALGVVDTLCFGTEEKDLIKLAELAELFSEEPDTYKKALKKHLDLGLSYPRARQLAVNEIMECGNILNKPNNILALEYLKALGGVDDIKPISVYRNTSKHSDTAICGDVASGSAVRSSLLSGKREEAFGAVPDTSAALIEKYSSLMADPASGTYYNMLRSEIMRRRPEELAGIFSMEEGIENRIIRYARTSEDLETLIRHVKSKRYTDTALRRLMVHILTGFAKCDLHSVQPYIRVLGFNENGAKLLKHIRTHKTATAPVITKIRRGAEEDPVMRMDIIASDMYNLAFGGDVYERSDFVMKPYVK
jgi:predicted nucleotidyltransferase